MFTCYVKCRLWIVAFDDIAHIEIKSRHTYFVIRLTEMGLSYGFSYLNPAQKYAVFECELDMLS